MYFLNKKVKSRPSTKFSHMSAIFSVLTVDYLLYINFWWLIKKQWKDWLVIYAYSSGILNLSTTTLTSSKKKHTKVLQNIIWTCLYCVVKSFPYPKKRIPWHFWEQKVVCFRKWNVVETSQLMWNAYTLGAQLGLACITMYKVWF